MSGQDIRLFGNALPINQLENFLIELRKSCHASGKAPARNLGAHAVDDQMVDGAQDKARETAAAIVSFETPVIIVDQRKTNLLVDVPAHFLGMRKPFADLFDDIGVEEALERAPAAMRIGLQ